MMTASQHSYQSIGYKLQQNFVSCRYLLLLAPCDSMLSIQSGHKSSLHDR